MAGSGRSKKQKKKPTPSAADGPPAASSDEGSKPVRRSVASRSDTRTSVDLARVHIWQVQAFRDVLLVAAVIGLIWFGYVIRAVTVPLLIALLLAYLFEPLVSRLTERKQVSRAGVVASLLACVVAAVVLVAALIVPFVVGQTVGLVNDVRGGVMRAKVAKVSQFLPEGAREDFERFLEVLPGEPRPVTSGDPAAGSGGADGSTSSPTDVATPLTEERVREIVAQQMREQRPTAAGDAATPDWLGLARGGSRAATRVIGTILGVGLVTFLVPFYFFFFSLWYPAVVRFLRNLIPDRNRRRTIELLGKMDLVVSGFVRGRIIISLVMGVMLSIGWMICGVPYAPVVGLITGVFCTVPYLGGIGVPVAVGLLFFDRLGDVDNGATWWVWVIVWPSLVFAIVQAIEGWILTPAIAGKVTNLDPVTILVAVLAGGSVLGVYGMLLAIPAVACLKILLTDVLLPRVHAWTRGEVVDPLPIERGR